ncbi:MAG: acyl-CoA thioesterase [Nannocystaceae bacterium]|nr:acyl-CoA thioesterase [Nannocystaceae bacterium]
MEIPVAWGEMDAFGHVNNVVFLRWFETGRMAFFSEVGVTLRDIGDGCGPILAQTSCTFLKPVSFPDTITVHTSIERIGTKSFVMRYRVESRALGETAAQGDGTVVWYDYGKGTSAPVPDDLRARLKAHVVT